MAWRSHTVAHPDYSLQTQFISRESYDIFLTLCDGLLSLMIAYRNYYPTYPLLPWLHSTEVCEHLFGMLRQLKKDFTYSDVLQLERKLRVLQMGAFGNLTAKQQANETAAGYHHTYFNANDYGLAEATQLLKLLGIDDGPSLRQKLIQRLASVVPDSDTITKTAGVDRYVRHAGTYGGSGVLSNARAENKATVQKVAAMKFVGHRAKAFVGFQWVHENMHLANISDFNPLKPGHLFIGLKPGSSAQVVLCEVVTMYTKNTMHDWIPSATSDVLVADTDLPLGDTAGMDDAPSEESDTDL
ncbi:hypothetical protein B0H14DRAFT_3712707 [Mycena olivaceomarginata]|nr:hypothetical protein B0H14DRAFT_3712707 [Mycena olivaceomarginata]